MNEFTKGEWEVIQEGLDPTLPATGYLSIQPIDAYIDHGRAPITDEDRANAHLIAAAPDLYKGCEIAEECFRKLGNCKAEALNEYAKTVLKDNARLLRQVLAKAKPKE